MNSKLAHSQFHPSDHTILLVEDSAVSAAVMRRVLERAGYTVIWAKTGEEGLTLAAETVPNLILLDVVLPGIDGFFVCKELKKTAVTAEIPVVFMTSISETDSKLKGFELGAVDYVTKPIESAEVLARIRTHLTLRNLQTGLQQEITEREKLIADLEAFAHTVAHDLKNPLNGINGYADLLRGRIDRMDIEQIEKAVLNISVSSIKMKSIIDNLLLLANVRLAEEIPRNSLNMETIVAEVLERLAPMIKEYRPQIDVGDLSQMVTGHGPWVEEIWVNYISNAMKYGAHQPVITIGATPLANDTVKFWVQDNGEGLSVAQQEKLFQPFQRLSRNVNIEGHGLGLSIVQRIARRLGGSVGVESTPGQGSRFYFTLPAAPPARQWPAEGGVPTDAAFAFSPAPNLSNHHI